MFDNLTPEALLIDAVVIVVMLGVAFPVHEFAHALAAFRLGDSTARFMGRLTLNPIAHFDPYGGLLLVISVLSGFGIGWAKPTP
jgi:Zn-dependent protease